MEPFTYPDGHEGWLVSTRDLARVVLSDPRFSARVELMHIPLPEMGAMGTPPPAQPGDFTGIDPPEHTRYRRLLIGQFTVRRMRQLTDRIREITTEHLDAMAASERPVDLVQAFARPVPALMICELLGVLYAERDQFQHHAMVLNGLDGGPEDNWQKSLVALQEFMRKQVRAKRAAPTDDLLSGLMDSDLTEEELTNVSLILLGAGLDTTVNMLALGTFELLRHPEQIPALDSDQAVEELLRYLTVIPFTVRVPLEDVELGGHQVRAGQAVTIWLNKVNRDPEHVADPDTLDLTRSASGQMAFGHGVHQCLGQQLARVTIKVALPALFARFPDLRLAVHADEVPRRASTMVEGLDTLPVSF